MYHEKLSDDIGHCKNLGYKYVFSIIFFLTITNYPHFHYLDLIHRCHYTYTFNL